MTDACIPPDPTKAGAHWLERKDKTRVISSWVLSVRAHALGRWYFIGEPWLEGEDAADGMRYLRPVLTPEQEDALHTEIDEMSIALDCAHHDLLTACKEIGTLRADRERLCAALTEATTARDDAADLEWRAM